MIEEDDVMDLTQDADDPVPSTSNTQSGNSDKQRRPSKKLSIGSTEDNTRLKSNIALEKAAKKQKMEAEKAAKKSAIEMNKIYKPGECMKYMNVEVHPALKSAWYMADLPTELNPTGAKLVSAPELYHPALLVWTRTVPQKFTAQDGQVKLTPTTENCSRALYVTTAEEIAQHVEEHTLASHVTHVRDVAGSRLTLVVLGAKDYFKSARRKNSNRTLMTDITLEMAIIDLVVSADCDTVLVNSPSELALLVVQLTRAIAEAPFKKAKRACDEQAEFYMRGDNKKCVAVDKDGIGVGRLWQQMLAVLPQSSLETSRALCAQYKSPRALYEAFQSPDGVTTVGDIGVARAAVPGSKARRVGPEFARKLRLLFTAQDGNVLVD